MTEKIKIGILDDHQIIIDGLTLLLQTEKDFTVNFQCTNGYQLIKALENGDFSLDLLIMDLMMPQIDGYEMALLLQESYPDLKIIILSMNTLPDIVYNIIEKTEVKGYLPKSVNKKVLLQAIQQVYAGEMFIHEEIQKELESYKVKIFEKEKILLTPREVEIVQLIGLGLSNKEIAADLYLSEHTISTHRKNIYRKTQSHNTASLLECALRLNIIKQ